MIGNRREEDLADLWLREHDPYYLDKSNSKKKKLERFYETPEQEHRRVQMELPFSSLSMSQMQEVGIEIKTDAGGGFSGNL